MENKIKCKFCGIESTKKNWGRHKKSRICQSYQNSVKAFNEMLLEQGTKIKTFDDLIKKPFTNEKGKTIYLNNFQLKFLNKLK